MFTGLIEKTGLLEKRETRGAAAVLTVAHSLWDAPCRIGDSMAVQGACLTITRVESDRFSCDALQETLTRTTLGRMPRGSPVNLERALRAGDRMGGHIVSGHVDSIGRVEDATFTGDDWILRISCGPELGALLAPKGSIACDGVSLTVVDALPNGFTTHVIPHTWSVTTLNSLRPGSAVNLEGDLLAKYVRQAVASYMKSAESDATGGLTEEKIRQAGF